MDLLKYPIVLDGEVFLQEILELGLLILGLCIYRSTTE